MGKQQRHTAEQINVKLREADVELESAPPVLTARIDVAPGCRGAP
jgi:hypothetical protein